MPFSTRVTLLTLALTAGGTLAQPVSPPSPTPTDPAARRDETLGAGAIASAPNILDKETREKGERIAAKAIEWLRAQQDKPSGGWAVPPADSKAPAYPAMTGLVVHSMLMQPGVTTADPAVAAAIEYMLGKQQPDGSICDRLLPVYNTSICLSALSRVDSDKAREAIRKGQEFLRTAQWGVAASAPIADKPETTAVGKEHPFYGGYGYGNNSRPDVSNLQFALQALHDTGVPSDDPAFQRALVFLQRIQMIEKGSDGKMINEMPYAKGSRQGGFIYATASNAKTLGEGQSQAGMIEETLTTGETRSMLRAYGSVSYAGFKSYLYAGLKKDDPRVLAVLDFCKRHYTLKENPNFGSDGQYYYYVAFARALHSAQMDTVETLDAAGQPLPRNWRRDLIDQLATMQNEDGSFKSVNKRWMEDNTTLITAYALLSLQHALR